MSDSELPTSFGQDAEPFVDIERELADAEEILLTPEEEEANYVELPDLDQDFQFASTDIIQAMQEDMDFFAGIILPDDCTEPFPDFYVWLWFFIIPILVKDRDFTKLAIGLPRGHGKTQVVKLLIIYAILFTKKRYIMIIGATKDKAESILADVAAMLNSENVQEIFGNWMYNTETMTQSKKVFTFQGRKIVLEAAGQGTAIRGTNRGQARPDFMVFDDSQTSECSDSITESTAYQKWFVGTALKAKSNKGCTFIYIGNMYKDMELIPNSGRYTCMLRMLQKSPSWVTFIVGALLQDGSALWEALIPRKQLLEEYQADKELGQEDIFYAEVLNSPTGNRSHFFDASKVITRRDLDHYYHQGNYIVIDPATSKLTADQFVLNYFEIHNNKPVSVEILQNKFTAPQTVEEAIKLAIRRNCGLIIVESNAYQFTLCEWLQFVIMQRDLHGLHIEPMHTSKNKAQKILRLFQNIMKGELEVTEATYGAIIHQAVTFNPSKNDNLDDILDSCAMGYQAALEFRHLMNIPGDLSKTNNIIDQGGNLLEVRNTNF